MILRFKIGTMPAMCMHVCRKRTPPKLGETIEVKPLNQNHPWVKPQRIYVDKIQGDLYFAARM